MNPEETPKRMENMRNSTENVTGDEDQTKNPGVEISMQPQAIYSKKGKRNN